MIHRTPTRNRHRDFELQRGSPSPVKRLSPHPTEQRSASPLYKLPPSQLALIKSQLHTVYNSSQSKANSDKKKVCLNCVNCHLAEQHKKKQQRERSPAPSNTLFVSQGDTIQRKRIVSTKKYLQSLKQQIKQRSKSRARTPQKSDDGEFLKQMYSHQDKMEKISKKANIKYFKDLTKQIESKREQAEKSRLRDRQSEKELVYNEKLKSLSFKNGGLKTQVYSIYHQTDFDQPSSYYHISEFNKRQAQLNKQKKIFQKAIDQRIELDRLRTAQHEQRVDLQNCEECERLVPAKLVQLYKC